MRVTDLRAPSASALGRISDPRAIQFWDADHIVSRDLTRIREANPAQPAPKCCEDDGFYWDDALLFAPHRRWKDLPAAIFWDGPIWKVAPDLEKALRNETR